MSNNGYRKGPAIRPSARIERVYRQIMLTYIRRMKTELLDGIGKLYGRREDEFLPDAAQDKSAATEFFEFLNRFFKEWQDRFDRMGEERAEWFSRQTEKTSSEQIRKMLREVGFTVEFKNSRHVNNIVKDIYIENVKLIKSIPKQMRRKVRGIVMRGVQAGNDQHFIATELQKQFGVTERRAQLIARDQTMKANAAMSIARSHEAGIEYGFWMHRGGSKIPRTTHAGVMDGQRFKLSEGLYDPQAEKIPGGGWHGRKVKPAELVNCHCTFKPDLSSFNPKLAADNAIIKPVKLGFAAVLKRIMEPGSNAA